MLNLVVLKRFGIFAILFFEIVAGDYFRQGSKDQSFSTGPPRHLDPSNYYSGIKRPEPRPTQSPHWSSSHYGAPGRAPMDMWIRVTLDIIAAVLYISFNKFTCLAITFCNVNLPKELA